MRFATSRDGRALGEPVIEPTPRELEAVKMSISGVLQRLKVPAPFKLAAGGITRKWAELAPALADLFGCPTVLENDSAIVGLGEAHNGAGTRSGIMVYLTISTGVGGARLVDGRIDASAMGFEPGHQIINFKEPARGWEDYVSGQAVFEQTGKHPGTITDEAYWKGVSGLVAIGLQNTILHWSPELVVLGGSMMRVPGIILPEVERVLKQNLTAFPRLPRLALAKLGEIGGLHGALALLNQRKNLARTD